MSSMFTVNPRKVESRVYNPVTRRWEKIQPVSVLAVALVKAQMEVRAGR